MPHNIPLFKIYWNKDDIKNINNALKKGLNWAEGENVEKFEFLISKYLRVKYCVIFNSGTSALHSILLSYDIRKGDEVIVPPFTFIATANAPLFVGARPVFADIEQGRFGLSPECLKRKITKRTKAIIAVHYGGCPCRIEEIKKIARKHNLVLIEDAAEAFGAKINNKKIGSFGDSAIFSFCQNKIITTGEGGCAVTGSKKINERLKLIRSHGEIKKNEFHRDYITLGFNFRMSNIVAALGVAQLRKVNRNIKMRRQIAGYLTNEISKIKEVKLPQLLFNRFNTYQMYPIMVEEHLRDDLIVYLSKKGIAAKVYFHPIHLSSFFRCKFGYERGGFPITESVSRKILSLPIYPTLRKQQVNYIVKAIGDFFGGANNAK